MKLRIGPRISNSEEKVTVGVWLSFLNTPPFITLVTTSSPSHLYSLWEAPPVWHVSSVFNTFESNIQLPLLRTHFSPLSTRQISTLVYPEDCHINDCSGEAFPHHLPPPPWPTGNGARHWCSAVSSPTEILPFFWSGIYLLVLEMLVYMCTPLE